MGSLVDCSVYDVCLVVWLEDIGQTLLERNLKTC